MDRADDKAEKRQLGDDQGTPDCSGGDPEKDYGGSPGASIFTDTNNYADQQFESEAVSR